MARTGYCERYCPANELLLPLLSRNPTRRLTVWWLNVSAHEQSSIFLAARLYVSLSGVSEY